MCVFCVDSLSQADFNDSSESDQPVSIYLNPLFSKADNPELDEEFDIKNLGIDLQTTEPLLPFVGYVGSDDPMVRYSQFPAPSSYPQTKESTGQLQRMKKFSDETLIFMFYLHARDRLQKEAYNELKNRGYDFDSKRRCWVTKNQFIFDVENWKFFSDQRR